MKDESNNQLSNIKTFLDKLSKSEEVDAKLLSLNNSIIEKAHFNADKTQEAIKILENFSQTQIDYSNLVKQKLSEIIEQAIQSSANQNNIKSSLIKYEENYQSESLRIQEIYTRGIDSQFVNIYIDLICRILRLIYQTQTVSCRKL